MNCKIVHNTTVKVGVISTNFHLITNEGKLAMTNDKNIKLIPLTQGKFAIVDAEDYKIIMQWKWHYEKAGYAGRKNHIGTFDGKPKSEMIWMHRLIAKTPKDARTDHINGDKLDNRKCNLRHCTAAQNGQNQKPIRGGKSKFKGVWWDRQNSKWRAEIVVNKKKFSLGAFIIEAEAARAYDAAALSYFGEFARINEYAS